MSDYLVVRSASGGTVDGAMIQRECRESAKSKLDLAKQPIDFIRLSRELVARQDQSSNDFSQRLAIKTACCAGCSYCCHGLVTVKAHEVFYAAEKIRERWSEEEIRDVIRESEGRRSNMAAARNAAEQRSLRIPCPLLKNHKCSAYEGRPLVCRTCHSMSVEPCRRWFENPNDPSYDDHQHQALVVQGTHLRMGAYEAFASAGYDQTTYEFGSALGEALSDPRCFRRWRDRKKAFSAQSIAHSETAPNLE